MSDARRTGIELPDVNVLVALLWESHLAHRAAIEWFGTAPSFATCSVTQTGFVRVSSNPKVLRDAIAVPQAVATLAALVALAHHHFLADDRGFVDNALVPHAHLIGHRQVTDAHLVAIARRHGARVVTFDRGLASLAPTDVTVLTAEI